MPNAVSIPYTEVLTPSGQLKTTEELRELFQEKGVDLKKRVIATCGSGITASVLMTAAVVAGANEVKLYDGSWTEYGSNPNSVILKDNEAR